MNREDRTYWLGFSSFSGIGPQKFSLLLKRFHNAKAAWEAAIHDLEPILGNKLTEKFVAFRNAFDVEKYVNKLEKKQVDFLTLSDSRYPELLKQISKPPFVLYMRGNIDLLQRNGHAACIAVVGTRKITSYGQTVTKLFTESLVQYNCIVVSGLALGVDAIAHRSTIEHQGKTIAVLGSGVDTCYPRENQKIYADIVSSGGAIVSEYPLGQEPTIGSFPSRNRIIAGLSDAVLVTEGAEDSGALITADHALEMGRKAFAIPGPITSSLSKGPYKLLKKGGILVTSPEELFKELQLKSTTGSKRITSTTGKKGDTKEEQVIIDLLSKEELRIDELIKRTGLSSAEVSATVSMMEIKGMIGLKNGYYGL